MHRRGICSCSSTAPSGQTHTHWNGNGWAHVLGAVAWVVQSRKRSLPLRAATAHLHWHSPQPAHVFMPGWSLEDGLLRDILPEQTGYSQGFPCGAAGVRWQVSVAAGWLPSPLSRHWASFLPDSLLYSRLTRRQDLLHDQGEQITSTLTTGVFTLFFTQSVD